MSLLGRIDKNNKDKKAQELIEQAMSAIEAQDFAKAEALLIEATTIDERLDQAWLLLAQVVKPLDDKITCLENVIVIVPNSWIARVGLNILQQLADPTQAEAIRYMPLERVVGIYLAEQSMVIARKERQQLIAEIKKIVGDYFLPDTLSIYLQDEQISRIIMTGHDNIIIEKNGQLTAGTNHFADANHFQWQVNNLMQTAERPTQTALFQGFLTGDFYEYIAKPPHTTSEAVVILERIFPFSDVADLSEDGITGSFMRACMIARINTLIIGEYDANTRQMVNELSKFIPEDERIITLQRFAQYQLPNEHVIPLEGADIMQQADNFVMRMRPDRMIFGELWAEDIPVFLQSGIGGMDILGRLRARDAQSALWQCEMALMTTYPDFSPRDAHVLIARAIQLIVTVKKMGDGTHRITEIAEIIKSDEADYITIQPIFRVDSEIGTMQPTGAIPTFYDDFASAGVHPAINFYKPA